MRSLGLLLFDGCMHLQVRSARSISIGFIHGNKLLCFFFWSRTYSRQITPWPSRGISLPAIAGSNVVSCIHECKKSVVSLPTVFVSCLA
jgi:hypothetical protein